MPRELTPPVRNRKFEEFRLSLLATQKPVAGDIRSTWYESFQSSVQAIFAPRKSQFRKPGLPAEMFKARVFLEEADTERWEEILYAIEREWRECFAPPPAELHTYAGFDGPRMVFEFAVLDQGAYLTGSLTVDRWVDTRLPYDQP